MVSSKAVLLVGAAGKLGASTNTPKGRWSAGGQGGLAHGLDLLGCSGSYCDWDKFKGTKAIGRVEPFFPQSILLPGSAFFQTFRFHGLRKFQKKILFTFCK